MHWKKKYKQAGFACLEVIAPKSCAICQTKILVEWDLCINCCKHLLKSRSDCSFNSINKGVENGINDDRFIWYDEHLSLYFWNQHWQKYLYQWKYQNQRNLHRIFFNQLEKLLPNLENFDINRIGIIDSGFNANRQRGYKQCHDLANFVALKMGLSVEADVKKLKRKKQSKNTYEERFWFMHNALKCRKKLDLKNYLLVEDIFTTGATANEAARMLKLAGANKVIVLSMVHQQDENLDLQKVA